MNKTNIITVVLMALHMICFANNAAETKYIYATDIDGVRIDTRDGLSENKIRSLLIDRDERLIVATSASVDIFDGTRFISIPANPKREKNCLHAPTPDDSARIPDTDSSG